jgi:opacity protein-like surface antigen
MAKKWFSILVLAAIVVGGAFALPEFRLSAGGNGDFMALFGSTKVGDYKSKTHTIGGGFAAFFDVTYAEIGLGMDFANQKDPDDDDDEGTNLTYFSISLLGKYPIALGEKVTLFPLLGFDWNIFTGGKEKNHDEKIKRNDLPDDYKSMYDAFLIDLGIGADFALTDALYLRGSFLYGFKLNSKYERDVADEFDAKIFTSGPTLKIGIGYKF